MPHDTPLIATIVVGLTLAFLLGALAQRIRVSPLVGYLLAGVAVGPYTPGFVADQALANELAEIGVILLMFGVGLHFTLRDLWSVRKIALPGAVAQMAVATLLGMGLAHYLGWSLGAGIVFGLALSVASTVVLLRALQERNLVGSERGRIAVGWLIVEDIAMVFALVLLPALAPLLDGTVQRSLAFGFDVTMVGTTILVTIIKISAFVALMMVVGRRIIPWVMHYVAHTGSRELFRLGVLAIALGVAFGAAQLFDVSFALGAFFAGMILGESAFSQRAAAESLPLRDAFAVLFFISVGMLFDPSILVRNTWPVIATVAIVVIGKSLAAMAIVRAFRHPMDTALTIAASLAQIGEFSFILAGLGVLLGILPSAGRDLILAGALLSIIANPLAFMAVDVLSSRIARSKQTDAADGAESVGAMVPDEAPRPNHVIVVGYGSIGKRVAQALLARNVPLYVIDEKAEVIKTIANPSIVGIIGNPVTALKKADLGKAQSMFITIAESVEAGQIALKARAYNPALPIFARATSESAVEHLRRCGATAVVFEADEVATAMVKSSGATGTPH